MNALQALAQVLSTHPTGDLVIVAPASAVLLWWAKLLLEIQRSQRETNLVLFGDREKGEAGALERIRHELRSIDSRVRELEPTGTVAPPPDFSIAPPHRRTGAAR